MVKNQKFQKMPKIGLAKNRIFEGTLLIFWPKKLLYFGPIFVVVFFIGRGDNVSCTL